MPDTPLLWPGDDDRVIVQEMLRDTTLSENWYECSEFVRRLVQVKTRNIAQRDQDDIVQDVMVRVHRYLPTFRFEARLSTWLFRITYSVVTDFYRKGQQPGQSLVSLDAHFDAGEQESEASPPGLPDTQVGVEEVCIMREELEAVMDDVREHILTHANPQRNAKIVDMVLNENRSLKETAEAVGCSAAMVSYVMREVHRAAREKRNQRK